METHRVAVISDTHNLLRPEVMAQIETCEAVFHGGDIGESEILRRLEAVCPVRAVRGNTDKDREELPTQFQEELYGFRIYMIHDRKQIREDTDAFDIVIYGHSHRYEAGSRGKTLYLNPGSCGPVRFRLPVTMAVLILYPEEHRIEAEKICISPGKQALRAEKMTDMSKKDMYRLIRKVMKEADAGVPVAAISKKTRADAELTEQICRMYMTHPGIDVDGIMDRMERRNL